MAITGEEMQNFRKGMETIKKNPNRNFRLINIIPEIIKGIS